MGGSAQTIVPVTLVPKL